MSSFEPKAMEFSFNDDELLFFLRDLFLYQLASMDPDHRVLDLSHEHIPTHGTTLFRDPPWSLNSFQVVTLGGMVSQIFGLDKTGLEDLLLIRPSLERWVQVVARSWEADSSEMGFYTSGSTGPSQFIRHHMNLLLEEVREVKRLLTAEDGIDRVVSFVPSHHIYGFLFSVLLPRLASAPVIRPGQLFSQFTSGDLIVALPTHMTQWLSRGVELPPGVRMLSSTGPSRPGEWEQLQSKGLRIFEIYGSSETSGIGYRNSFDEPFTLFSHWTRSSDHAIARNGRELKDLPDFVRWTSPRTLVPHGRKDKAVQISGYNVVPAQVAKLLKDCPLISDAQVRAVETERGAVLKAFVVPRSQPPDNEAIETWVRSHLAPYQRPQSLTYGPQLPRNAMGKLCDW